MTEKIVIIDGVRTPFMRANGAAGELMPDDLGAFVVKELAARASFPLDEIDELIFGNVLQLPQTLNIARVISVKGGLSEKIPAVTINRNCASGMEAIAEAANKLLLGQARVIFAGGTESMSHYPILYKKSLSQFFLGWKKAKNWRQKLSRILPLRPSDFLPESPVIADPLSGLLMGQTAEILARDFMITREEQDLFSLHSHQRAINAAKDNIFFDEIIPIPLPPNFSSIQLADDGPRSNSTLSALAALPPAFEPITGTVTAGNSSQVTDGAAGLVLTTESYAKRLGIKPLGSIKAYSSIGLAPERMGLGPYFATAKVLRETGLHLRDFDLVEINEAFAVQVLAVLKAFSSAEVARRLLGLDAALGELNPDIVNVNGGAIALGHPLGASGARLVLTLLKELIRRKKKRGLATLCVGGGQGLSLIVEVEE
jgi:acetyl-CoA acyltransferase